MKKFLLCLTLIAAFAGCTSINEYNSLPPAERAAYLQAQAVAFLKDPATLEGFQKGLTIGGIEALDKAVDGSGRKAIADQMWSVAVAFRSLATGEAITSSQVTATIRSFSPGVTIPSYVEWTNQAGLAWSVLFPKFQLAGDAQLAINYLLAAANAAEDVAKAYGGGQP